MTAQKSVFGPDLMTWVFTAPERANTATFDEEIACNPRVDGDVQLCPLSDATKRILVVQESLEREFKDAVRGVGTVQESQDALQREFQLFGDPIAHALELIRMAQTTRDAENAGVDTGDFYAIGIADGPVVIGYPTLELAQTAMNLADVRRRTRKVN